MLKIKDNVDLKELEKFGFEFYKNGYERLYAPCNFLRIMPFEPYARQIYIYQNTLFGGINYKLLKDESIVSDLIQAGLVEKVEG